MLTYFDETIPEMESIRFLNRHLKLITVLKMKTHFDLEEIQNLLIIHHKLTKEGGSLNYRKFREIAHRVFDIAGVELYDKIYSWCDPHRIMHVSLENWVLALSVLLRGSLQEKIDFCWKVYDLYGTGYITRELMFQYLKSSIIKASAGEDSNEVVKDLVDVVLKKMDVDRDGKISYEDYQTSVFRNPMMLEALGSALPPRPFALGFLTTFTSKYVNPANRAKLIFPKACRMQKASAFELMPGNLPGRAITEYTPPTWVHIIVLRGDVSNAEEAVERSLQRTKPKATSSKRERKNLIII